MVTLEAVTKTIYFDHNNYLREQTRDPQNVQRYILTLKTEDYLTLSLKAYLYRILNQPKEAIRLFKLVIPHTDASNYGLTLLRLGEAYKYDNEHAKALLKFEEAYEDLAEEHYDFYYQHKAKCLWELGKLEEARKLFLKAQYLRKQKQDTKLIHSTTQAIRLIEQSLMCQNSDN